MGSETTRLWCFWKNKDCAKAESKGAPFCILYMYIYINKLYGYICIICTVRIYIYIHGNIILTCLPNYKLALIDLYISYYTTIHLANQPRIMNTNNGLAKIKKSTSDNSDLCQESRMHWVSMLFMVLMVWCMISMPFSITISMMSMMSMRSMMLMFMISMMFMRPMVRYILNTMDTLDFKVESS